MKYNQLSKTERQEIFLLRKKGYSLRDIGKALSRNVGTISREIKRNSIVPNGKGSKPPGEKIYLPDKAELKKYQTRKYCKIYLKKLVYTEGLRQYIEDYLQKHWSPEQIAGRWNESHETKISYRIIYRFVYSAQGQKFYECLYSKRYKPKKRRMNTTTREMIKERVWIDERREEINKRETLGHFEGDLIVSRKGERSALLTVIERKSRYLLAEFLPNRSPKIVEQKIHKIRQIHFIHSITLDNGIEFKNHMNYGCETYFCHPYSSWEKGQIEYANRLIRRFIPKKSVISDFSPEQIQKFVEIINNTPRKCLNYKTPYEVYTQEQKNQNLLI